MADIKAIESVISQARSLSDSDLDVFCEGLITAINSYSISECTPSLRQLFVLNHSTRKRRRIPQQLVDALVKILLVPDKSRMILKVLASSILTELAPSSSINLPIGNLPWTEAQIPYILPVVMTMGPQSSELQCVYAPQIVRWLSTVGLNVHVQTWSLCSVVNMRRYHPYALNKDHQHVVDCQLGDWLKTASVHQATNPYSRGIFKRDEQQPITEIDGQATKNFFTALCVGQYYTDDQILNIHSFALLQSWLYHTRDVCPYGDPGGDSGSDDGSGASSSISRAGRTGKAEGSNRSRDPSPTHSIHSVIPHPLEDSSLQYALRILDQWDRKPKVAQDADMQQASVIESVGLLNQLCQCDPSLVPRVFEAIKRLYNKLSPQIHSRLLVPIMQFFLNFSDAVVYDAFPLYELFLGQVLSSMYAHPAVAFDTIMFVQDNRDSLILKTQLLTSYFPNLLKILAWNPLAYISEFVELLPAFISQNTAMEVFHTLVDLPLLSAALEMVKITETSGSDSHSVSQSSRNIADKLKEPRYKPFFKFLLRSESGRGDTIDRLETLHNLLNDLTSRSRVLACADTVPILLRVYFEVVLTEGDAELASTIVLALLERSGLLYRIPSFQTAVQSVLAEHLLALFKHYPQLMMDQYSEILDFISSIRNITPSEDFFLHVVWLVGEYLCSWHDARCTPDRVAAMYEALEALAYEVYGLQQTTTPSGKKGDSYSARLITSLMSALAKLASRSQDLIPRVLLCLTKLGQPVGQDAAGRQAVTDRASELVSLLKVPNIAAMVLSPQPEKESGRWHTDNLSLPAVLRATSLMIQTSSTPTIS